MAGTKNKMSDLHNILFEQLERLNDIDVENDSDEVIDREVKRSTAIKGVAGTIIQNADLCFKAVKHADEYGVNANDHLIPMLTGEDD